MQGNALKENNEPTGLHHQFYSKSRSQQTWLQIKIISLAIAVNLTLLMLFLLIGFSAASLLILCISASITLSIIAPFLDVPSLVKQGRLVYYSPLLLAEQPARDGTVTIHAGTLFDYCFTLSRRAKSQERRKQVFLGFIKGMIKLIDEYSDTGKSDIKIRATSYIFSEKTAMRIGFRKVNTDFMQRCILYFNYFNLLTSYSFINGGFSLLSIKKVVTFESEIRELIKHKNTLLALRKRIDR